MNHSTALGDWEDDDISHGSSNLATENVDLDVGNPDLSELGAPPGYETLGFTDSSVPPPYVSVTQPHLPEHSFADLPFLSEDDVRDVIIDYAGNHSCYGSRAAREMNINNIIPSNALHYELVTFTECRHTKRINQPYSSGEIDSPSNGTPPAAWEMEVRPQHIFIDEIKYIEIPHTESVCICHICHGSGKVTCGRCLGRRRVTCSSCHGRGRVSHTKYVNNRRVTESKRCGRCSGSGKVVCGTCCGNGRVQCKTCRGLTKLKWYVQLTVTFANMVHDHVVEHTDLPNHLINDANGTIIFQETEDLVQPIINHPDQELNSFSESLLTSQLEMCRTDMKKIHRQKHTVRAVPVSEIHWTWQTHGSRFWVYGDGRKIYITKYPQKNCWGCQIL